jgi:Flp pilus assembly protein TadD
MRRYLPELALSLLIAAVTFAVFARAVQGEFVLWDDDVAIVENPLIRSLDRDHLDKMFLDLGQGLRYRPLIWLTWALIYSQVELKPFAYHLVPVLLHCANGALVFLLLRKLGLLASIANLRNGPGRLFLGCCAAGALLWSLHPLRVEAVAWANGLPYGQTLLFLLLSLLSYLQAHELTVSRPRRWLFYALSIATYALSAFTYPIVLGFPLVLFVLDFFPFRRLSLSSERLQPLVLWKILLEKLPFFALSGVFVLLALYVRTHPTGHWQPAVTLDRFGIQSRIMQAFYIWAYYVWKPWWPFDLAPIYMRLVTFQPLEWPFVLSAYGVILLTGLLLWRRRQWPVVLAVWAAYLILLVPVLGLTEHPHFSSDRYSYIPGIAWSVLALGLLLKLPEGRWRGAGLAVALVLAGVLGVLSHRQVSTWQNTASLYEHTIEALGDHPFRYSFQVQLARLYKQQRNYPRALDYYSEIAARNPHRQDVFKDLGEVLVAMGEPGRAAEAYTEGLKITPQDANLYCGLGQVLSAKGNLNGAATNLVRALELNPNLAPAHRSLGEVLERQGKVDEAKMHFERAAQLGESSAPQVSPTRQRPPNIRGQ